MSIIKNRAFTILELILVIAVLAMLAVLTVKSLSALRSSNRDNKRTLDVRNIQAALEEYYHDAGIYPASAALVAGQPLVYNSNTYINFVPNNPQPIDGTCPVTSTYPYSVSGDGQTYTLQFCLGYRTADAGSGINYAYPGSTSACVPDCYMSCNASGNTGDDGCGNICANAMASCQAGYSCVNNHCLAD